MLETEALIRAHLRIGLAAALLIAGVTAAWSVAVKLDSAVVTQGVVVVESNIKKVQHPTGGVVGAINVREGQLVKQGDVVVRLDETATRTALGIVLNELTAARARAARLIAERAGASAIVFPDDLVKRGEADRDAALVLQGELQMFKARAATRQGQKEQLIERVGQLTEEVRGLGEQTSSLERQLVVAREELANLRDLQARKLTTVPRITALEREIARNEGALG